MPDLRPWLRRHAGTLGLILLPLALVLPSILRGELLFGHDFRALFFYQRGWIRQELLSGRFPVWDPHTLGGFPALGALQGALFYPGTWFVAIFEPGLGWALGVAAHASLAGLFARAWLSRGLGLSPLASHAGACLFMLSGFLLVHRAAGHLNHVFAYPWIAAALWRFERFLAAPTARRWLFLGAVGILPLLAGVPQYCLFVALALSARGAQHAVRGGARARRDVALAASSFLWGAVLAAPQILPAMELIPRAQRSGADAAFASSFSMPPENLLALFCPSVFGSGVEAPYVGRWNPWETTAFAGVAALALAVFGLFGGRHPQRFLWAGLGLAALLLALGRYAPFFEIFRSIVPGAGLFRAPGRFLGLFTLCLAPLVALGIERLREASPEAALRGAISLGVGALLLALLALLGDPLWSAVVRRTASSGQDERPHRPADYDLPLVRVGGPERASEAVFLASGAALALAALLLARARGRSWAAPAALALLAVELLNYARPYTRGHSRDGLEWPADFAAAVRAGEGGPWRLSSADPTRTADVGRCQLAGLDHAGGFEPMMPAAYAELFRAWYPAPDGPLARVIPPHPSPFTRMLGVRLWIGAEGMTAPPGWTTPAAVLGAPVFEGPDALPRAWAVGGAVVEPDPALRLAFLKSSGWDPALVAVVDRPVELPPTAPSPGRVRILDRAPGYYRLEADFTSAGLLLVSETAYPGWTAEFDGAVVEPLAANHLIQGVRLEAGRREVVFRYRPTQLGRGLALGLLALLIGAGLIARERLKARGRAGP